MPDYAALAAIARRCACSAPRYSRHRAAAAIGHDAARASTRSHITFVFLGWSLASVAGMPIAAWIGETHFGWRAAFAHRGPRSPPPPALWVHAAMPDSVKPPALSRAAWREPSRTRR